MSDYNPDNWVVLKIDNGTEIIYKILAGWSGSYLSGNSWKLNSGITEIEEDEKYFHFRGYSGSVYHCHKESEMVRMNIAGVLQGFLEKHPDKITKINSEQLVREFNQ